LANLDNVIDPLDSPDLARAITQSIYADRLLATNTILRLPTNIMWTATGNNLTFKGDLSSRALICLIDANREHPEERTFQIANLIGHLQASRKQLVMKALTILRAYQVAGPPSQDVRPWGGFDNWSREFRAPLLWLGLSDPCASREQIVVNDPDREFLADILHCWTAVFGEDAKLARELIAAASEHAELQKALWMVSAQRGAEKVDPQRLGTYFARVEGRVIDGMRLVRDRKIKRAVSWRVSLVSQVSPKPVGSSDFTTPEGDQADGKNPSKIVKFESYRPEIDSQDSSDSPQPDDGNAKKTNLSGGGQAGRVDAERPRDARPRDALAQRTRDEFEARREEQRSSTRCSSDFPASPRSHRGRKTEGEYDRHRSTY
jgi:hypothetical protein